MFHIEEDEPDFKSVLVTCTCRDITHVFRVSHYKDEDDFTVEFIINPFYPFFLRLWYGLRWIINPKWNLRIGNYDNVFLHKVDAEKLSDFLKS